jgi:POT family proton-dependent oligopeptide transporter
MVREEAVATQPLLWGYPKGVLLVAGTELWERFSYWGLMAIFVLFLTAGVERGGFGWTEVDAIKLYGAYVGAAFAGPLLGGWIANNYWGERRCILLGGLMIAAGHLCLAGPALMPWLVGKFSTPVSDEMFRALWLAANVPLGHWTLSAEQWQQMAVAAGERGITLGAAKVIYRLTSVSFFGGLLLVLIGTGLIKPTISSIVSHFFVAGDRRRDSAFGLFFAAVYVGCILGTAVVGFLGERMGWHWGFAAAALGMLLSLTVYLWKQRAYLGDIGVTPVSQGAGVATLRRLTRPEWDRIKVILWQGLLTALYAAAFFQAGGLLLLFVDTHLDRGLLGWTIPSTWLVNVATLSFVILTPCAIRLWNTLERRGRNPSAPVKLAWGLLVIGAAYLLLACLAGMVTSNDGSKLSWLWMALVYVLFGVGDVLVWPNQIALTSRLAPRALSAVFIGGWYLTIGIGTWMTGYIGTLGYTWGLRPLFFAMSITLLVLGAAAWWLTPRMLALTHGVER